ncbi:hypothetical protein BH11PSE9_BH11PSE9_29930 [soil metagenome]
MGSRKVLVRESLSKTVPWTATDVFDDLDRLAQFDVGWRRATLSRSKAIRVEALCIPIAVSFNP